MGCLTFFTDLGAEVGDALGKPRWPLPGCELHWRNCYWCSHIASAQWCTAKFKKLSLELQAAKNAAMGYSADCDFDEKTLIYYR